MKKNVPQDLGTVIITPEIDTVKRHKLQSQDICDILAEQSLEQGKDTKALNIANCGTWLNFRQYFDENSTKTLHTANFCKSPLCPMCAWRKALKLTHQVEEAIKKSNSKYIYHLVLATDNTHELNKEHIKRFKGTATRFIRKYLSKEYAISLEITYSAEKGYHPHIHALVCTDTFIKVSAEYIKHSAVMWASYIGSNKPQNTFYITGITDREKASRELTKYILKYEGINIKKDKNAVKDIASATASMKKIQASGELKKNIAQASRDYERQREDTTKELEKNGFELEIYNWVNGEYIKTN